MNCSSNPNGNIRSETLKTNLSICWMKFVEKERWGVYSQAYSERYWSRARVDEASEHRRAESLGCWTGCGSVTICCAWKIARPRKDLGMSRSSPRWKMAAASFIRRRRGRRNGLVGRRQRSTPSVLLVTFPARIWNVRWTSLIYPWRERIPSIETGRIVADGKTRDRDDKLPATFGYRLIASDQVDTRLSTSKKKKGKICLTSPLNRVF